MSDQKKHACGSLLNDTAPSSQSAQCGSEKTAATPLRPVENAEDGVSVNSVLRDIICELTHKNGADEAESRFADYKIFAVRVSYNREQEAAQIINDEAESQLRAGARANTHVYAYAPVCEVVRKDDADNPGKVTLRSLISNLLFLFATPEQARDLLRYPLQKIDHRPGTSAVINLRFMYDHTRTISTGINPVVTIRPAEMRHFMQIADSRNPNVQILPNDFKFEPNKLCRVTSGPFAGLVGYSARVNSQSVLLVDLRPLGFVKSCYISKKQLEIIDEISL